MAIATFSLVALDCPDPRCLATFYAGVVGSEIKDSTTSDDWVRLENSNGTDIAFQRDPAYRPPQ